MSPENAIFELLAEELNDIEVHPTVYTAIENLKTVRVGNCESYLAPNANNELQEFDAKIQIQVLIKTDDEESASFPIARDECRALALQTAQILHENQTLNGNACDIQILPMFRGWATVQTVKYAAAILTVIVNPREYGV